MAEKASGGGGRTKKQNTESQMGHNLTDIKKKASPALKEILGKFDDMEADMGSYRSEIKELYEKHANSIGCPRKILKMLVKEVRDAQRLEAALEEMEKDEREQLERLQAALDDTPFGKYIGQQLADKVASEK